MVLCNALYQNAVTVDSLQRKAASYFCQRNKTPFFSLLFLLVGNNKENILSLVSFSWYAPALHRQENANRRILNQITDYDSVALVRC